MWASIKNHQLSSVGLIPLSVNDSRIKIVGLIKICQMNDARSIAIFYRWIGTDSDRANFKPCLYLSRWVHPKQTNICEYEWITITSNNYIIIISTVDMFYCSIARRIISSEFFSWYNIFLYISYSYACKFLYLFSSAQFFCLCLVKTFISRLFLFYLVFLAIREEKIVG